MLKYIVKPQEYLDLDLITHKGKRIEALENGSLVGKTGYVEWEQEIARLKLSEGGCEILVDKLRRGRNIGDRLFEILFEELRRENFKELKIFGVTMFSKGFYDKIFRKKNLLFQSELRQLSTYTYDYNYKVNI